MVYYDPPLSPNILITISILFKSLSQVLNEKKYKINESLYFVLMEQLGIHINYPNNLILNNKLKL